MNGSTWPDRLLKVAVALILGIVALSIWGARDGFTTTEWVQVSLTTALVLVTMSYVMAAGRQARASAEIAKASLRPIIVLGRDEVRMRDVGITPFVRTQGRMSVNTTVCNAGSGPAINLRVLPMAPGRNHATLIEEHSGLAALGAGEMFSLSLRECYERMGWVSHDLCVEYEDVAGRKWRSGLTLNRVQGEQTFAVGALFCEMVEGESSAMGQFRKAWRFVREEKARARRAPPVGPLVRSLRQWVSGLCSGCRRMR